MRTPIDRPALAQGGAVVEVLAAGTVGDDFRKAAQAAIGAVLARHRRVTGHPRIRLSGGDCAGGLGLVQVNLRVCGAPARVQVAGRSAEAAIAAAADRLERQVRRLSVAWEPWPWPDPQRRTLGVPGVGAIARLKSLRLYAGRPCQAAAFMNAMDYDVVLYTDVETGEDAVVYRAGPTGLCLARQHTMHPPSLPVTLPLTVNPRKTPILTPARAAARVAEHWLPFVFYTDHDTRRGSLLYRRYDGDLGLVTPAGPSAAPGTTMGLAVAR